MRINPFFIVAFLAVSTFAVALPKEEPRKTGLAVIHVNGSEIFKVIYKSETIGRVKLNIYNASGQIILSEKINAADGFICPVNFKGLEHGVYTIELVDAQGSKSEKVNYQPAKNLKHVHVSRLIQANNKFLLAITNVKSSEQINVKIYDANSNLVHAENKVITGDFAKVYKIENASGLYRFEITDEAGNTKTLTF